MSIETLSEYTREQWHVIADRQIASAETRLFIDGAFVDCGSGGRFESINPAHRMIREVEAGVIWVSCFDEGDMTQPFGGYKQSGHARDKCIEGLLSYTQGKSACVRLSE